MATMTANPAMPSAIQGSRTQTIVELENLLGELRHIEEEESQLLELASDRQAQAAVFNELARIETQQRNIMEQLNFVKKQRVVDKARQISEDQRKLVQLMQDAANAEIAVAQQSGSPGRPLQTQYSLRSSGTPGSLQSGYFARSASAQNIVGVASGSPRSGRTGSPHSGQYAYPQQEQSRLAPVRTSAAPARPAAPAADGDMEFSKKHAREEAAEEEKKDDNDDESDFGHEAKKSKRGKGTSIIVSGGLPGFKIAKDLYTKDFSHK